MNDAAGKIDIDAIQQRPSLCSMICRPRAKSCASSSRKSTPAGSGSLTTTLDRLSVTIDLQRLLQSQGGQIGEPR
jgi:hypothetical protein